MVLDVDGSNGMDAGSDEGAAHHPGIRQAAEAIYSLASLVVRMAEQPRQLSLTAVSTLATLERTGSRRITDLAAAQSVTQPSMTTLVTSLEQSGMVARGSDPTDRRAVLVTLTDAGSRYLRDRRRSGSDLIVRLIEKLPPDEAAALAAAAPALGHLRELDGESRPGRAGDRSG
jgi:DNA-binding MarR family transcriptional regulator